MVKITKDMVSNSLQYLNPNKEYHLSLKGKKLMNMENLIITGNVFECIDLSNNLIMEIPLLPNLSRLQTLILNNNKISCIEKDFGIHCKKLENLILTNNQISSVSSLENLASCKTLKRLSLVDNIISCFPNYRKYMIYKMPNLKILDFNRITLKERVEVKKFFEEDMKSYAPEIIFELKTNLTNKENTNLNLSLKENNIEDTINKQFNMNNVDDEMLIKKVEINERKRLLIEKVKFCSNNEELEMILKEVEFLK